VTLEKGVQIEMGGKLLDGCYAVFTNDRYVLKAFCFDAFLGTENWTSGRGFIYDTNGNYLNGGGALLMEGEGFTTHFLDKYR